MGRPTGLLMFGVTLSAFASFGASTITVAAESGYEIEIGRRSLDWAS